MRKLRLTSMLCMGFALLSGSAVRAQSAYSNAVMALSPVAYWPLQETTGAVSVDLGPTFNFATGAGGFFLGANSSHNFIFFTYNANGTGNKLGISTVPITTNVWQHLVVTFDGTNGTMYLNGALAASQSVPPGATMAASRAWIFC
jgi:hypothetical protein